MAMKANASATMTSTTRLDSPGPAASPLANFFSSIWVEVDLRALEKRVGHLFAVVGPVAS